jgi:TRAP transporter TAXI family solute receptor
MVVLIPYFAWIAYAFSIWLEHPTFKIGSGGHGGLYFKLGDELAAVLNDKFSGKIRFENLPSKGSNQNVDNIEAGLAQLGLAQDGLDYGPNVQALARLYNSPYHFVVPKSWACKDFTDLKRSGAKPNERIKVFLGAEGSGTRTISLAILGHYGMTQAEFEVVGSTWTFEDAAQALVKGEVDAAAFLVGLGSEAMNKIASAGDRFTLVPLLRTEGIVTAMPFLEKTTIFAASYPSTHRFPDQDVMTVSTRELLVASRTISERHAFKIVETLFSSSAQLVSHFPLLTQLSRIEPERNFYYPLHSGASAFYRRSGVPSVVTPERVAAAASYSVSIATAALIFFRRRRVRLLFAELDAILESATPATPESHKDAVDRMAKVQRYAFNLHKDWKIREDGYNAIKEYIALCSAELARKLPGAPQIRPSIQIVEVAAEPGVA